jgi:hypothetical protein
MMVVFYFIGKLGEGRRRRSSCMHGWFTPLFVIFSGS